MGERDDQTSDDIFEDREDDDADETSAVIRRALAAQGIEADDDDDGAGFDQPPIEEQAADDRVSQEDGAALASDAQLNHEAGDPDKAAKGEDRQNKDGATEDAGADDAVKDGADDQGDDLANAAFEDLVRDVPEASRAEITRRLTDAEKAMAPFQTPYAQEQMRMHGTTPQEVSTRLMQLAEYAATKPDEYLAWAAREMASSPDKVGEVLGKAAELHGYKLTKLEDEDDDDLFDDEETRNLKRENAELKRQINGEQPTFGPDAPAQRQQRDVHNTLQNFITERNPDGSLKRPHFAALETRITAMAQEKHAQTQQPITVDDLETLYQAAEQEFRGMFGNPAAQAQGDVPNAEQRKAAAGQKAKRASTSIDGSGQGASRRPALPENADIDDVIRHSLSKQIDG